MAYELKITNAIGAQMQLHGSAESAFGSAKTALQQGHWVQLIDLDTGEEISHDRIRGALEGAAVQGSA